MIGATRNPEVYQKLIGEESSARIIDPNIAGKLANELRAALEHANRMVEELEKLGLEVSIEANGHERLGLRNIIVTLITEPRLRTY